METQDGLPPKKQTIDPRANEILRQIEVKDELRSIVKKANLSDESLEFLDLRYTDDLTLKEIAKRMAKTENEVRALYQKTNEKLSRAKIDLGRIYPNTKES